jgi:hypothetical protein
MLVVDERREGAAVIEFLTEAFGWLLFDVLLVSPAVPETDAKGTESPRRSAADLLTRWVTLLFGVALVVAVVGAPVLWATGAVEGLTAVGIAIAGLIAGRVAYLLARSRRNRV